MTFPGKKEEKKGEKREGEGEATGKKASRERVDGPDIPDGPS